MADISRAMKSLSIASDGMMGFGQRNSPRSLKLWKEAREVLQGNEMVKSGKVKLRILEEGETSE